MRRLPVQCYSGDVWTGSPGVKMAGAAAGRTAKTDKVASFRWWWRRPLHLMRFLAFQMALDPDFRLSVFLHVWWAATVPQLWPWFQGSACGPGAREIWGDTVVMSLSDMSSVLIPQHSPNMLPLFDGEGSDGVDNFQEQGTCTQQKGKRLGSGGPLGFPLSAKFSVMFYMG